jgi:hypothetical protein
VQRYLSTVVVVASLCGPTEALLVDYICVQRYLKTGMSTESPSFQECHGLRIIGLNAEPCICRYHADLVPPRTRFKSRQRAGRATTRCHVPHTTGTCLPAMVGSGAATCSAAPDPASLIRRAPALPQVLWL